MKKLLAILLSIVMIASVVTVPAFADGTVTHGYDNLNNEPGELVIGFLGGSITVADGDTNYMGLNRYATRVTNWFQEEYPNKTVKQVNAGIGGTGSDLGKYRVMTDIGAYAPDVVFVEYAVNDANYSALYAETVRSNMETIVRNLQSLPKVPVIVFLYSMHDNSYSNIKYTSIPDHQEVADYYGIESINFYEYMSALVEKGEFVWNKNAAGSLTNDNIHPNALGHEQYGNYIISQLESRNILHKNKEGLSRRFISTTKDTRDIKFANADNLEKTGTWENEYAGQSDNKYEAIQSTAAGDSVSFTYTSAGNDTVGVTVLRGEGTFVIDEGTANEKTGTFSVTDNNLPVNKEFASGLSAGVHTVKVVNTGNGVAKDGSVAHLKLGRIIANGGAEVNAASTAANGDHIPASMPKNLLMNYQIPYYLSGRNDSNVELTAYSGDYTSNNSYTVSKFAVTNDVAAGGNWGIHGLNFPRYGAISNGVEVTQGIRYENNTATAGTYVFKARVRTLSGNPTVGATTVKSYKGTFDNEYGKSGFAPSAEWQDYRATLTAAEDGFTVAFGVVDGKAGDAFLLDAGDGVYIAPEVAYDVELKGNKSTTDIIAGGKNTYKATVLNQIGIAAKTTAQTFTWSVVDASGNAVEGLTATPCEHTDEVTVNADADVPYGTYYLKAVSTATSWQKTLPIEVVEGPVDPYARDHVPGEMPANRVVSKRNGFWYDNRSTGGGVTFSGVNWINGVGYAGNTITATQDIESVKAYYGAAGVYMKTTTDASYPAIEMDASEHKAGDHYVFMFAVRNANTALPAQLRLGVWNGTYSGSANDYIPVQEYPNGIIDLPQTGEWVTVKATLAERTAPADGTTPSIRFGLPVGSVSGASMELNIQHPDVQETYFAKEVPHSVSLKAVNSATIAAGESADFEAQLLNQLGLTGYLDQTNVTFTVGNDKGEAVEGLTVTSDDNVATVSSTGDVAPGEYYLRAHYTVGEDTTWTKTLAVKIRALVENTEDYVVGEMPDNLVNPSSFNGTGNSSVVRYSGQFLPAEVTQGQSVTAFFTSSRADNPFPYPEYNFDYNKGNAGGDYWGVEGVIIKFKDEYATQHAKTDTTYVVSAKVRSTVGGHRINTTYARNYNKAYTTYADGKEGFLVEGTDWQDYKTVITTDLKGTNERLGSLLLGLVHAPADSYLLINLTPGLYVAEEVAYDIEVTGASNVFAAGDAANLSAKVVNQIGLTGALEQKFNWVAVTPDRVNEVDGITFETSDDGKTVTVNVAEDVAPGEYIVVAQSKYGMNRQYPITVTAPTYDVTELTLNVDDTTAVLEALTVETTKAVKVVLAAFTGTRLIEAVETVVTPEDGEAVLTDPLKISDLSTGDKVRVFVWDMDLTPFTMKNLYKLPVTVE